MNDIQNLNDKRTSLANEMETLQTEALALEVALESPDVIENEKESGVRTELSDRKLRLDAIAYQISVIDQKLHHIATLEGQDIQMAGYIADMENWKTDEQDLRIKRQSLSDRLEQVRKQTQEDMADARQAETDAASAYARAVAWGDIEGEETANKEAQKAAKNLSAATEIHRRQLLIITALEQELVTVDEHIKEAVDEHRKIERTALNLAYTALQEKWNESAKQMIEVGGKLYAAACMINHDPVSLLKLDIPEQGGEYSSWKMRNLADCARKHGVWDILAR
jgi:hypothetical protein